MKDGMIEGKESVLVLGVVQAFRWKPCEIGVFHSPHDIEKSVGYLTQLKEILSCHPGSIPPGHKRKVIVAYCI